jgi:hypothetical protein
MADEVTERQLLAERWRLIGEMLQSRSPELFEKLLVMVVGSALAASADADPRISEPYTEH